VSPPSCVQLNVRGPPFGSELPLPSSWTRSPSAIPGWSGPAFATGGQTSIGWFPSIVPLITPVHSLFIVPLLLSMVPDVLSIVPELLMVPELRMPLPKEF